MVVLYTVDGCIPSDLATGSAAEIEEERRLLYVAMTRAKRHLALLVPQRFHVTAQHRLGDRHVWASLTRFVPPSVAALFDVETAVTDAAAAEGGAACAGAAVDLAARARAAFRRACLSARRGRARAARGRSGRPRAAARRSGR